MGEFMRAEQVKADLQRIAWRDFISWAVGEPEMLLRYERDTGKKIIGHILAPVLRIAELEDGLYQDFIIWVTKTYWGEEDAPPEYHELVRCRVTTLATLRRG
jgi:hypothetical protein